MTRAHGNARSDYSGDVAFAFPSRDLGWRFYARVNRAISGVPDTLSCLAYAGHPTWETPSRVHVSRRHEAVARDVFRRLARPLSARRMAASASGRNMQGEASTWLPGELLDLWCRNDRATALALLRAYTSGPRKVLP